MPANTSEIECRGARNKYELILPINSRLFVQSISDSNLRLTILIFEITWQKIIETTF